MNLPSHTTVVAYVALIVALGTGGAYAVDKITSRDIAPNTIRSSDVRDRAISGRDVRRNGLTGKEIRENTIDGSQLVAITGANDNGPCDPPSTDEPAVCAAAAVELADRARLVAIASGGQFTEGPGGSQAACDIRIDGDPRSNFAAPGEVDGNTSPGATNGFARTLVTPDPVSAGTHEVSLACRELDGDVRIDAPTLAVLAISAK